MPSFTPKQYLPVESYIDAAEAFHCVCGMILFEFAREQVSANQDIIIRNWIARTDTMVKAILRLWDIQDYQDCWVIHRCLIDRLFHLHHLSNNAQFDIFEEWSFLRQYKDIERIKGDEEFGGSLAGTEFDTTQKQNERARDLNKNPPNWKRPKAEDVAKKLDMSFLYRYSYDYASKYVHPMADDGLQDFFTITKLEPAPDFIDQRSVLSNTILVATILIQEGLNASSLLWSARVYDTLHQIRRFLDTGLVEDFVPSVMMLIKIYRDGIQLCTHEKKD